MKPILSPSQMRLVDKVAEEQFGIPPIVLMENAARSSFEAIIKIFNNSASKIKSALVLCGSGNNGGDGFAIARRLFDVCETKILWIGDSKKMSSETLVNYEICRALGIDILKVETKEEILGYFIQAGAIIDALIGVGGSDQLRGVVCDVLDAVKYSAAIKIAIDVPTGLHSELGFAADNAFKADYTITMEALKTGLLLNDAIDLCGKIEIAPIGAPFGLAHRFAKTYLLEKEDLDIAFETRKKRSSKFDYGRVLIIAGSKKYSGAAALTANACITAGAGLVELYSTHLHPALLPEIIFKEGHLDKYECLSLLNKERIKASAEKADVIAIGPGLGESPETLEMIKEIVEKFQDSKKIVIDADGLKAFEKKTKFTKNVIITPHYGEFASLLGLEREDLTADAYYSTEKYAIQMNCVILSKGCPTIISDGEHTYFNINGNPGMATAGSGDVLTGVIAALLAQGMFPLQAGAFGAYVHALAGDSYAARNGERTLTASRLIDELKMVI